MRKVCSESRKVGGPFKVGDYISVTVRKDTGHPAKDVLTKYGLKNCLQAALLTSLRHNEQCEKILSYSLSYSRGHYTVSRVKEVPTMGFNYCGLVGRWRQGSSPRC